MSKILFIGTLATDKITNYCYKQGVGNSSADNAQRYILDGLGNETRIESIDIISGKRLSYYPKCSIKKIYADENQIKKGKIKSVGFNNYPILGFIQREYEIILEAKKWAKSHKNESDVIVMVYSMHSPFMKAAKIVKKIIPTSKIVLIVADLPLLMNVRGNIKTLLKKLNWITIKKLMNSVDKYLLYSRHMAEYLNLKTGTWMVFEGLMDEKKIINNIDKNRNNICIYAGNLEAKYGIGMLIEAFKKIKSDAMLHIYGQGEDLKFINDLIETTNNVKYMGSVTSEQIFEIMKNATLLINPRPTTLELSKYSCPSKTFEYMASGTPVLMTKLPGLPKEYEPYVFFVENETVDGFAKKIDYILKKSDEDLNEIGLKAAGFLKKYKNSQVVIKNVLKFIDE